jgi:ankyrin repeat protein
MSTRRVLAASVLVLGACATPQQRALTAAESGDVAQMTALLDSGLDPNTAQLNGGPLCPEDPMLTPLQAAVCAGQVDTVKLLLDRGARADTLLGRGGTALTLAAQLGRRIIAKTLLDHGADPNTRDRSGTTPLMVASRAGNAPLVRLLLAAKAEPGLTDAVGNTALTVAGSGETAKLLIDGGADPAVPNNAGDSPLKAALKDGRTSVVEVLRPLLRGTARKLLGEADGVAAQANGAAAALPIYKAALDAVRHDDEMEILVREKLIRFAARRKPALGLPEEARKHVVQAQYLLKQGASADDVEPEMSRALELAPWWAEGYYNLGVLQANGGRYAEARKNLKIFAEAAAGTPRAQQAQDKIYELEIAQKQQAKIQDLAGEWVLEGVGTAFHAVLEGGKLKAAAADGTTLTVTIHNNLIDGAIEGAPHPGADDCTVPGQIHPATGRLSSDGHTVELDYVWSSYETHGHFVNPMGQPWGFNCLTCHSVCDGVNISATTQTHARLVRR